MGVKRPGADVVVVLAVMALMLSLSSSVASDRSRVVVSDDPVPQGTVEKLASQPNKPMHGVAMIRHWNEFAIDMSGLDHTPGFGEQVGPGRSSRALAIVQIAVFDAVNAIEGGYRSYTGIPAAPKGTSLEAAVSQAAHDTLVALFPSQAASCHAELARVMGDVPKGGAKTNGIDLGRRAAAAILALRQNDGSAQAEPVYGVGYVASNDPGKWRQDPISQIPVALGAFWYQVAPFVIQSTDQFRVPPPPALDSVEYANAYNEAKDLGGDGTNTLTSRSPEQTTIGIFWAYDGRPSLCAPPRLYNQIAVKIARERGTSIIQTARLLALINVAMADAGMAIWESKYYYQFWRPVTGIRESDPNSGPSGLGDGNDLTEGDTAFSPLGAPASNGLSAVNFTPPFPAYPSGHAGFGGALFEMLRNFYGTDNISFSFTSDEFNGVTKDNNGNARPVVTRSFSKLSQAEEENGQSRIYLGIHWSFDKTEGIAQGRAVADYVYQNAFTPVQALRRR